MRMHEILCLAHPFVTLSGSREIFETWGIPVRIASIRSARFLRALMLLHDFHILRVR